MNGVELLGMMAGLLTTTAFVPQAVKSWRTGSARDFSLPMLAMFCAGLAMWLGYGLIIASPGLVLANGITLPLAAFILSVKLRRG
ncbi:MAG TPA: SemiSWEET transporter [Acetobacteraceae bacterium]|nr:SemiSWEET transporter [Acetobacteraceae bacterium]